MSEAQYQKELPTVEKSLNQATWHLKCIVEELKKLNGKLAIMNACGQTANDHPEEF